MKKNPWAVCLKWGAILGVALSILEVVRMFARRVQYGNLQLIDIAMIILYILLLYWGGKEFKENYPERLSFAKAFLSGALISLVGALLLFCYSMVHFNIIEPNGLTVKYELALNRYKNTIEQDTITANELTAYMDTVRVMMNNQAQLFYVSDTIEPSAKQEIKLGLSKINQYYDARLKVRQNDTAKHYQLHNFSSYSRQILGMTLQTYLRQNVQSASSPFVAEIVGKTNTQLVNVNPADIRYEKNKSNVPHYDKPYTYASVNAMMQLLYGMFFSIFVALYLYRSKHPIEEEPELPHTEGGIPIETEDDLDNQVDHQPKK